MNKNLDYYNGDFEALKNELQKPKPIKVELIKEVNFLGEEWYYTMLDGKYVTGSGTSHLEKALQYYEFIKENKSNKSTEVIKQSEI